jgi:outer membrane receptor protein involved in Fe transport
MHNLPLTAQTISEASMVPDPGSKRRCALRTPRPTAHATAQALAVCLLGLAMTGRASAASPPPATQPAATQPSATDHHTTAGAVADPTVVPGELLLFQDMPIVITASRQAQPLNLSAVPVSIIGSDDIHFGSRTTLPGILQFVPGIDVHQLDRVDYSVGIHGLDHSFADRTLTLINGRDAANPMYGSADLLTLPVLLEDIDRIEVVRASGGAAWGANALNGVINIITKKPEDIPPGVLLSTTVTQYGDTYNQLRWTDKRGPLSWRLSLGYENINSSADALNNKVHFTADPNFASLLDPSAFTANDFARDTRFDTEVAYRLSDQTRLSAGLAGSSTTRGSMELFGMAATDNTAVDTLRAFAKMDVHDDQTSGYLQWFTNYYDADYASLANGSAVETDLESQWTFAASAHHKLTLGGNVRVTSLDFNPERSTDLIDDSATEYNAGLFVMDRWQITRRFALEAQLRGDWYSATGADWSGRLTGFYAVDPDLHHVLRLGIARAFREPALGLRALSGDRLPLPAPVPPGVDAIEFVRNPDLGNEHVASIEVGYTGELMDHLTLSIDGYFQRYDSLIGARHLDDPLGLGRSVVQLQNIAGGSAPGAEAELTWADKYRHLSLWYAYNDFQPQDPGQDTRSFFPVSQQAGLNGRWFIGDGLTFNTNFKYSNFTTAPTSQWDMSLTKSIFDHHAEISIGVSDLLNETRQHASEDGQVTSHETPGRTFFFRIQGRF